MSEPASATNSTATTERAGMDPLVGDFCGKWEAAWADGDDDAMTALLTDPPAPIADAAEVVQMAEESGDRTSEYDEAVLEVLTWIELACNPEVAARAGADPANRRIAPVLAVTVDELEVCRAGSELNDLGESDGGVVLYGDTTVADPFAGEMLGVFWGTEGSAAGDGDSSPVTVRGVDGVAAPFTVFQQVVLDELGTVIAWEEEGFFVGLYGRGFDAEQIPELLAYAEALSYGDDGFELPSDALPPGFGEVYAGSPATMSIVIPTGSTYDVIYRQLDADGLITVSGYEMTAEEFHAFRFLALPLGREDIGGRDAVVGNTWGESGPAIVTWREADGLVVRLVGNGSDLLEQVRDLAIAATELDRDQWAEIVNSTVPCFQAR